MIRTLVAAAVLLAMLGCSRGSLSTSHGEAYRAVFAKQRGPDRPAGPPEAAAGLDSQEAAIVADTYRRGLAPEGADVKEEPVLIVAPQGRDGRPQQLAPSVPR